MKRKKEYYKSLCFNGFQWVYFENGLHVFVKGNYIDGYKKVCGTEKQLEQGDIMFAAEMGLSLPIRAKDLKVQL